MRVRRRLAVVVTALAVMGGIVGLQGDLRSGGGMQIQSRTWAADAPTGVSATARGAVAPQSRSWA